MKYFILFLLSILPSAVVGQGQELKKGLIMPKPGESSISCCTYIPSSGLTVYNEPNGEPLGKLEPRTFDGSEEVYGAYLKVGQDSTILDYTNFHMIGYEVTALLYVDKQGAFVKTHDGYWLSVEELESKELILTTWMDYLIKKGDVLGWYANEPGLNLRAGPSTENTVLATLKGDLWEITLTEEVNGLWCKVTVKQYREHPCSGGEDLVVQTLTGWVKLLADEQTPNVWNYSKGC